MLQRSNTGIHLVGAVPVFDSRIFYLQMSDTRTRPQLVTSPRRRQPRPQRTSAPRGAAGR